MKYSGGFSALLFIICIIFLLIISTWLEETTMGGISFLESSLSLLYALSIPFSSYWSQKSQIGLRRFGHYVYQTPFVTLILIFIFESGAHPFSFVALSGGLLLGHIIIKRKRTYEN